MMSAIFTRRFAGNYLSTLVVMGLAYWTLRDLSGFHRGMLQAQWQFGNLDIDFAITIHQLLSSLVAFYAVILIPYYVRYPWLHSKAFVFFQGLWFSLRRLRRPMSRARAARGAKLPFHLPLKAGLSPAAKPAGLALLLKFFFAPLMINWCLAHAADMTNSVVQLVEGDSDALTDRQLFDTWIFWAAFQAILFVDTFLFTIGYIIEVPALKNRIRSVDPTFFGWFICLICYPPFNEYTSRFFVWQSSDFPHFQSDAAHFFANACILTALAIYSWASVALGFKASNLTNRGIVAHGPYAWVRHPAYAAKNLAWWIGAVPNLVLVFTTQDLRSSAYALLALIGWTTIYVLRAITEERHLLMANNGYAEYAARVRWRFIPGVV
jgi:protein-S-isoprenylcysteine O-methyltransferase Ste14